MGKLLLRSAIALALAAALLWSWRAQGALAQRVRTLAKGYIAENTLRLPPISAKARRATAPRSQGPLRWPLAGQVSAGPGKGILIAAPSGALVRAAGSGKVAWVRSDAPGVDVAIQDGDLSLVYGHLGPNFVRQGQAVHAGEVIGEIPHFAPGETPALSLEARKGGKPEPLPGLLGAP